MQISIKSAVIAALAIGAGIASTAANAGNIVVPQPSTGSSDLLFFVTDVSNNTTYTRVLTQTVANEFSYVAGTGTQGAVTTYTGSSSFNVDTGADATLTSFISNAEGNGDTLNWGIIAGAYTAPASTPGNAVAILSANDSNGVGSADASIVTVSNVALSANLSSQNGLGKDITKLVSKTANSYNATNNGIFGTSNSASGKNINFYGTGVTQIGALLGTSENLYAITESGAANVSDLAFNIGTIALSADGTSLTFTANPSTAPVPVPAAVWLLGSGLLGLAGVGRRRAIKTAAV